MTTRPPLVCLIVICLQWTQLSVWAHHATAAQFDTSRTIKLKGIVSKLDWANPHAHLILDIKSDHGAGEHWDLELASPGGIIVSGLSRDLLKPGTILTATGYPGRNNAFTLCATQVTLPDGTTATFVVGV